MTLKAPSTVGNSRGSICANKLEAIILNTSASARTENSVNYLLKLTVRTAFKGGLEHGLGDLEMRSSAAS